MKFTNSLGALASACLLSLSPAAIQAETYPPNFVFILVDDLGWTDFPIPIIEACIFNERGLTAEARIFRATPQQSVHSKCKHQ